ncbi:MAG: hypothetical protein LBM25_08005 [Bacteroidales bacterium]|jgi:hypothetical protein|nr:hypothetical protein [Bacteroidales bacterium]
MEVAITIPIYKPLLSQNEQISFERCLKILNNYDIILVCYKELNTLQYKEIAKKHKKQLKEVFFDKKYFKSIQAYSNLLINSNFYKAFLDYEYILIYQVDAYVFKDELLSWCNKNYDYIGAPWFNNFKSKEENEKLMGVGNGGLSLRKVKKFFDLTHSKEIKYNFMFYYKYFHSIKAPFIKKNILSIMCMHNFMYKVNEDYFLVYIGSLAKQKLNVAPINEAINFAFDKSPSYLFELNNKQLPFGCHAFEKNQYDTFWKKYI